MKGSKTQEIMLSLILNRYFNISNLVFCINAFLKSSKKEKNNNRIINELCAISQKIVTVSDLQNFEWSDFSLNSRTFRRVLISG